MLSKYCLKGLLEGTIKLIALKIFFDLRGSRKIDSVTLRDQKTVVLGPPGLPRTLRPSCLDCPRNECRAPDTKCKHG